jgi:cell fate regulator YaaT (PSP1 superfamily)
MLTHFVRFGVLGHVGRFRSADAMRYPRRARVIVRTSRGLEIGDVLSGAIEDEKVELPDGEILRPMTVEDQLLEARLERHRQRAFDACTGLLLENQVPAVLVDVEHLFDGQRLFFYFLGDVTPELEAYTSKLADVYETEVQFRKFTETVIAGCGPGCGTEEAAGQGGCDTCTSCAVKGACGSKKM